MARVSDVWKEDAECAIGGHHPDLWFDQPREAKKVCVNLCPVREECLSWALTMSDLFGVAGGLTERERRVIRGRKKRTPTPEKKEKAA